MIILYSIIQIQLKLDMDMPWYACASQWRKVMNGYEGVAIVGTWVLSCCVVVFHILGYFGSAPGSWWRCQQLELPWAHEQWPKGQEWPKPQPPLLNFLSFPVMSSNSSQSDSSWLIIHYSASLHGLHLHRNLHLPASQFHPGSRDDPRYYDKVGQQQRIPISQRFVDMHLSHAESWVDLSSEWLLSELTLRLFWAGIR